MQDNPNNRPPHITMRIIPTAKKTIQSQTHPKRQPNGQWNIIAPATIPEIHQDLHNSYKKSPLLMSRITHKVDAT